MSFTRDSIQELCDIVESKPDAVLGNKFFDSRLVVHIEVSTKSNFQPRLLVISKFRLFLLFGHKASSLKIDRSYHILHIKSMCVVSENETALMVDENGSRKRIVIRGYPAEQLVLAIIKTLRHYFPDICALLPRVVELTPMDLYDKADKLVMDVSPRPCHSFRRTYAALCDLHDQPYRDEVAWDVEKIYTANRIKDLRLEDFSHLQPKDLLGIVSVLQYSSYFTGLIADGIRLSAEMIDVIVAVIKYSLSLNKLILSNCGLTREFPGLLASALSENESIPLETIDLSKNNTLDDRKGFASLSSCFTKMCALSSLNVSECALSEKSLQSLCNSLYALTSSGSSSGSKGIVHLNIASNIIKDDISSLVNLISIGICLRSLNLSDTHLTLDKLWQSFKFGCLQLESLTLSGCIVGGKKISSESVSAAKDFFAASVGLKMIDLSRVQLTADVLKAVLTGLASNNQLEPFSLILDGSCEKLGEILEVGLCGVRASALSLRDCHLENDLPGVIQSIGRMPVLSSLSIGGANVVGLKKSTKTIQVINKAINELVKLITTSTTLRCLSLADGHLGGHVSLLINSLGACSTIRSLDLSANDLGNFGMRILSKALELNTSIRDLSIDNNHIGSDGLGDLAFALEENLSLLSLPCPFNDIAEALQRERDNRSKISSVWYRIECSLERNRRGELVYEVARKKSSFFPSPQSNPIQDLPIKEIIEDFVEKMRVRGGDWIRDVVHGGERISNGQSTAYSIHREEGKGAEREAISMLSLAVQRDVYSCLSQWMYLEMVSAKTNARSHTKTLEKTHCDSPSYRSGTPQSDCASPSPAYRPRSIVADLKNSLSESVIVSLEDLVSPPSTKLDHPTKSRPRPLRKKMIQSTLTLPPLATIEDDRTSSPTDSIGSNLENKTNECPSPISSRVAILPPSEGIEDDSPSLSPAPFSTPPSFPLSLSNDSPPPLPKRQNITPPSLPPKPDKGGSSDESVSRRSVADMARLFSR
ncbi:crml-1 [Pristionchus pacificus]|uniref:Crml-1 n=1 Tax=Pristionchus pacificus TaxID=54126 RepID=A0A2A6CCF3_PRIPA|nr:crml-1 [Pristionchus pacificus]|eukprot:PDM75691.1 crml-1 [Pristionchus pacificus]